MPTNANRSQGIWYLRIESALFHLIVMHITLRTHGCQGPQKLGQKSGTGSLALLHITLLLKYRLSAILLPDSFYVIAKGPPPLLESTASHFLFQSDYMPLLRN